MTDLLQRDTRREPERRWLWSTYVFTTAGKRKSEMRLSLRPARLADFCCSLIFIFLLLRRVMLRNDRTLPDLGGRGVGTGTPTDRLWSDRSIGPVWTRCRRRVSGLPSVRPLQGISVAFSSTTSVISIKGKRMTGSRAATANGMHSVHQHSAMRTMA